MLADLRSGLIVIALLCIGCVTVIPAFAVGIRIAGKVLN